MTTHLHLLLLLLLLPLSTLPARTTANHLHIHIIAHSHCDPGWLETFEGYYNHRVKTILNNVLDLLVRDSGAAGVPRKFVWSESSFFHRWWKDLPADRRQAFKKLVRERRVEFIGGGWSQNDEANPQLEAVVNQVTTGHQFLRDVFGVRPRFAWQIDPFGHSAMTPSLFALMGFEAVVINRIHHRLKAEFKKKQHMEFIWKGVDVGGAAEIFTHVLHSHYSAPKGFDFEGSSQKISKSNVARRAKALVGECKRRATAYRSKHLLVPFGDDFKFFRGQVQFSNMDQLIKEINSDPKKYGATISYSTLSDYFDAVQKAPGVSHPVHEGDFFPYADNEDSYWTGYYTTRPHLKYLSRRVEASVRAAEIIHAMARVTSTAQYETLLDARMQTGMFLHHDAITGTCRVKVNDDYVARMSRSKRNTLRIVEQGLGRLLVRHIPSSAPSTPPSAPLTHEPFTLTADDERLYPLVIFNTLGWSRDEDLITVGVATQHVAVYDSNGLPVVAQVDISFGLPGDAEPSSSPSPFKLRFVAKLPALGSSTYFIKVASSEKTQPSDTRAMLSKVRVLVPSSNPTAKRRGASHPLQGIAFEVKTYNSNSNAFTAAKSDADLTISSAHLAVELFPSGLVRAMTCKSNGRRVPLKQGFHEYRTSKGGAYLFRPSGGAQKIKHTTLQQAALRIAEGAVATIVEGKYHSYRTGGYILQPAGKEYVFETEVTAARNQEVVLQMTTTLDTEETLMTHNGYAFMRRTLSQAGKLRGAGTSSRRQSHITSNFYPMVLGARLIDTKTYDRLTLWNDRTVSVGSLKNGHLEMVIHRHLAQDDGRGLAQPVADTAKATFTLVMKLDRTTHADVTARSVSTTSYMRADLAFTHRAILLNNPVLPLFPAGDRSTAEVPILTDQAASGSPAPSSTALNNELTQDHSADEAPDPFDATGSVSVPEFQAEDDPTSTADDNAPTALSSLVEEWTEFLETVPGLAPELQTEYAKLLAHDHVRVAQLSQFSPKLLKEIGVKMGPAVLIMTHYKSQQASGGPSRALLQVSADSTGQLTTINPYDSISHYASAYHVQFSPLRESLPREVHLLSLLAEKQGGHELIVRLQSLATDRAHSWSDNWSGLFHRSNPDSVRALSLALHNDLPQGHYLVPSAFDPAHAHDQHAPTGFLPDDDTVENQNTEEAGVWLSDAALDAMKEDERQAANERPTGRRLLADSTGQVKLTVSGLQLRTYRLSFPKELLPNELLLGVPGAEDEAAGTDDELEWQDKAPGQSTNNGKRQRMDASDNPELPVAEGVLPPMRTMASPFGSLNAGSAQSPFFRQTLVLVAFACIAVLLFIVSKKFKCVRIDSEDAARSV